ncbi:MAG: peroxiredoxin [Candidatus Accumulibacter sp.]|jgi:peroxiredoxin Q/BCP|nr:peroxiredoxin [Accumulibacter sp.]
MIDSVAEDFELPVTGGGTFRLGDHADQIVVLYFYPRDGTPGCTTEARQFRDLHREFVEAGCIVAGVSRDSLRSHENFKARYELPFDLLSDADEKLCARFSVIKDRKLYGKPARGIERSTFVFDRGVLRREWRGVKVPGHAQQVLDFVRTIPESGSK